MARAGLAVGQQYRQGSRDSQGALSMVWQWLKDRLPWQTGGTIDPAEVARRELETRLQRQEQRLARLEAEVELNRQWPPGDVRGYQQPPEGPS